MTDANALPEVGRRIRVLAIHPEDPKPCCRVDDVIDVLAVTPLGSGANVKHARLQRTVVARWEYADAQPEPAKEPGR